MRLLLSTFGSRGDVEPLAALGAAVREFGAEPVVCAPPDPEFADGARIAARLLLRMAPA